jgi:hypothetical protein
MWYFAYGSDLSHDSIMDWSKSMGRFVPPRGVAQPAVLINHRLCFPAFENFWRGGVADAVPEVGKSIGGALFKVTASTLRLLDQMAGRQQNERGIEQGVRQRQLLEVRPYKSKSTVLANVYRLIESDQFHVPPTEVYLKRMADAAWQIGLSAMWIMHLGTFSSRVFKPESVGHGGVPVVRDNVEIGAAQRRVKLLRQTALVPVFKSAFPPLRQFKNDELRKLSLPMAC